MREIDPNKTIIFGIRYQVQNTTWRASIFMTEEGRNNHLDLLQFAQGVTYVEIFEYNVNPKSFTRVK
jgi:hypothetical protein